MAGTLQDNMQLYREKQPFKYIPPTPPKDLIDATSFYLDFISRKFVVVGLAPGEDFNAKVHIITSSRHVVLSPEFLKRMYNLMGNILSVILDTPDKSNTRVFLEDDEICISKMVYRGENMAVIESKLIKGCRILLNRQDLLTLQNLEICIFEAIYRKKEKSRPAVINQVKQLATYFFTSVKSPTDMISQIKNVNNYDLNYHKIEQTENDFTRELILFAAEDIAQSWTAMVDSQLVDETDGGFYSTPLSPPLLPQMSEFLINAPKKPKKPKTKAVDQNDGPSYYDMQQLPINYSDEDFPTQSTRWEAKRKLFI